MDVKLPFFSFIAFNFRFKDFHHTFDKLNKKMFYVYFILAKITLPNFFLFSHFYINILEKIFSFN